MRTPGSLGDDLFLCVVRDARNGVPINNAPRDVEALSIARGTIPSIFTATPVHTSSGGSHLSRAAVASFHVGLRFEGRSQKAAAVHAKHFSRDKVGSFQ